MWRRGGAQPRVALIVLREVLLIFSLIAIYAYMSGQAIIAQDGSAEGFVQYLTEYSAIVLLCMPLLCVIASYIIQDVRYLHQRRLNRLYEYQQEAYEAALGSQQRFRHNIVNMLYGLEGAINSEGHGRDTPLLRTAPGEMRAGEQRQCAGIAPRDATGAKWPSAAGAGQGAGDEPALQLTWRKGWGLAGTSTR